MSEDRSPTASGETPSAGGGRVPGPIRPTTGAARVAGLALVAVVVLALVGGVALVATPATSPGPSAAIADAPSAPPHSAAPSASAGAGPQVASPPPEAWGALALPALSMTADLTADGAPGTDLEPDATFTLRSLDGTPATTLAAGLSVEPKVDLAVAAGAGAAVAVIRPSTPLVRGTTYRFALADPAGALVGGWAFRVAAPPRIVGTLPSNHVSGVPVDTGIEIVFDQPGVADPTPWFTISPRVAGRFEQHDRTWVFVPDALAPATVYTFTVRPGIPLAGSDLALQEGLSVRFETAAPPTTRPVSLGPGRDVVETSPGDAPVIGVEVYVADGASAPASVLVRLYRLPDVDAAVAVATALADRAEWTEVRRDAVDVADLTLSASVAARLDRDRQDDWRGWLRFPAALPQGWYLADLPDEVAAGQQVLIQVTPIAAYVASAPDRTVVWVNRIGRGPIAGATVRLAGRAQLGRTDGEGLLVAKTPAAVYAAPAGTQPWEWQTAVSNPVVVVEAAGVGAVVLPLGIASSSDYGTEAWSPWAESSATAWTSSLSTDRGTYRRTDSIAAWGVVRERASGDPPASVRLELRSSETDSTAWGTETAPTAVASVDATPSALGVFTATIPVDGVPVGSYTLALSVDGRTVRERWLSVDIIRKPAYRLTMETDRRAVMAGDPVTVTGLTTAYDGTPLAGIPVRFDTQSVAGAPGGAPADQLPTVSTGSDGRATFPVTARTSGWISVSAASTELGEIGGDSRDVVVFPASVFVRTDTAERVGDTIRVSGAVSSVDLPTVEAAIRAGEESGLHVGPPAAGVHVQVVATSTIWVARRSGTRYDFILKRTVPTYTYAERKLPAVTGTAVTRADGSFSLRVTLPPQARGTGAWTEVTSRVTDARGRIAADSRTAGEYGSPQAMRDRVWLDPGPADAPILSAQGCGWDAQAQYAIGATLRLTLRDDAGRLPTGGLRRYLFVAARDGIRDVTLGTAPVYVRRFDGDALPDLIVSGVAFDGSAYRETEPSTLARVDLATREIDVVVSTNLAAGEVRRPGDAVTVTVRTRDRAGGPVSADVVVGAVDQKIYDMGLAWDDGSFWTIWNPVGGGLSASYLTHRLPLGGMSPGCGSTTGGGGGGSIRDDFRDRILFVRLHTGPEGTATTRMDLPDDLTSWHVAADAVTEDLRIGSGTAMIPVGLPFFVEPVAPDTVLAADRPGIVLRAYGSALAAGDTVRYTVRAPTLFPDPVTVTAPAFANGFAWLTGGGPSLPVGTHRIVVDATARTAAGEVRDAKQITLEVVPTRVGTRRTSVVTVVAGTRLPGAADTLTTCTLTDAGRASLVPSLEAIAAGSGPRADQGAAASAAASLLAAAFGRDGGGVPATAFDPDPFMTAPGDARYSSLGVALVPYGSPDPQLTALAALGAPDVFGADVLSASLEAVLSKRDTPRDVRIVALAGLAALGVPVLTDLRAAATVDDLTESERAWLAVGLAEAGDLAAAGSMERGLLSEAGQRAGGWARVRVGGSAHASIEATALLAIAAARIGDPLAEDLETYVRDGQDTEAVHPLEEVAYASRALARLPSATAGVAYTIGGERREVDLTESHAISLALTPAQRATAVLDPLEGAVSAACAWDAPADAADLPSDPDVSVARVVAPAGPVPAGSLVTIELRVTLDALAPAGLYRVVETLPAGLAPTGMLVGPSVDGSSGDAAAEADVLRPWSIVGNRAEWGFWWDGPGSWTRLPVLRTTGRVVAPGTYAWEPAVVQLVTAPAVGASVPATTLTVLAP